MLFPSPSRNRRLDVPHDVHGWSRLTDERHTEGFSFVRIKTDISNTVAEPDYGIGSVGKCIGPSTSKNLRNMAAKYFEHTLVNQSVTFYEKITH